MSQLCSGLLRCWSTNVKQPYWLGQDEKCCCLPSLSSSPSFLVSSTAVPSPLTSPPFLSLFVPVGTACLFNVVSPWLPVCHADVMSLIINFIMLRPRRMYAENRPWHFRQQKDRSRVVHLRILKGNSEQTQVSLQNVCVFTYKIRRYIWSTMNALLFPPYALPSLHEIARSLLVNMTTDRQCRASCSGDITTGAKPIPEKPLYHLSRSLPCSFLHGHIDLEYKSQMQ